MPRPIAADLSAALPDAYLDHAGETYRALLARHPAARALPFEEWLAHRETLLSVIAQDAIREARGERARRAG